MGGAANGPASIVCSDSVQRRFIEEFGDRS
jgi:hypothetical protein